MDNPSAIWRAAEAHAPYRTRARLKRPGAGDDLIADYRYLGLTLGPHPMSLLRDDPALRDCRTAADLLECRPNQFVRVAGIVTCRQRPGSATGVVFMTLEDETGNSNIIVWNAVLTRYRAELLQGESKITSQGQSVDTRSDSAEAGLGARFESGVVRRG